MLHLPCTLTSVCVHIESVRDRMSQCLMCMITYITEAGPCIELFIIYCTSVCSLSTVYCGAL